jgi:hypothetical protein
LLPYFASADLDVDCLMKKMNVGGEGIMAAEQKQGLFYGKALICLVEVLLVTEEEYYRT